MLPSISRFSREKTSPQATNHLHPFTPLSSSATLAKTTKKIQIVNFINSLQKMFHVKHDNEKRTRSARVKNKVNEES
jgi:hypothetical protein